MRMMILFACAAMLGGCMTTTGGMRKIVSTPEGALVTIEGFGECETPCTVKLDTERLVTVAKAGYSAQRFRLTPNGGTVKVLLELAAPAGEVDETALPDL